MRTRARALGAGIGLRRVDHRRGPQPRMISRSCPTALAAAARDEVLDRSTRHGWDRSRTPTAPSMDSARAPHARATAACAGSPALPRRARRPCHPGLESRRRPSRARSAARRSVRSRPRVVGGDHRARASKVLPMRRARHGRAVTCCISRARLDDCAGRPTRPSQRTWTSASPSPPASTPGGGPARRRSASPRVDLRHPALCRLLRGAALAADRTSRIRTGLVPSRRTGSRLRCERPGSLAALRRVGSTSVSA